MKLLTQEIKKKLPKIYETESIPLKEKEIVCKFFNPCGAGTWYAVEGQQEDDDFVFWGLVDLHEQEFGYFSLRELESIKLPLGLRIERDIHFEKVKVAQLS
ncbi:MAG: hypothetical protein A2X86_17690 [Bdellovibrionales bacterium GWA2_49_15]|nr:MAG: hypothetical protein A2X86_17690 [Bdellovibrionales bacterium GWA2_49_15]